MSLIFLENENDFYKTGLSPKNFRNFNELIFIFVGKNENGHSKNKQKHNFKTIQ